MTIRLVFFFAAFILLAVLHSVALTLHLYWTFPWFDIPMHVLGGATVALGYSILPFVRIRLSPRFETVWWYLGAVLCVGVLWEIFEYAAGISLVREESFVFDTTLDLGMDLIGGFIGYIVAKSVSRI